MREVTEEPCSIEIVMFELIFADVLKWFRGIVWL